MDRIIYRTDEGRVVMVVPSPEALEIYGIMAIAIKDVPAGKRFKIVSESDLPSDYSTFDSWTVDEADLTDGVGGDSNEFD